MCNNLCGGKEDLNPKYYWNGRKEKWKEKQKIHQKYNWKRKKTTF